MVAVYAGASAIVAAVYARAIMVAVYAGAIGEHGRILMNFETLKVLKTMV